MRLFHSKKLKDEKGQAMVEFALVLPVLLLVLCGILEFSWVMYGKLSLENAAREGARAGSVGENITEATTSAQNRIIAVIPGNLADGITQTISFSAPSDPSSGDITVNLQTEMDSLTPIAGVFGFDSIPVEAECIMKMF